MADPVGSDVRSMFVARWSLRPSTARACGHVLVNGKGCNHWGEDRLCSVPYLDHAETFWQPVWRRHVVTSQPYAHAECITPDIETYRVVWGARLLEPITLDASWHHPGSTVLVALVADA